MYLFAKTHPVFFDSRAKQLIVKSSESYLILHCMQTWWKNSGSCKHRKLCHIQCKWITYRRKKSLYASTLTHSQPSCAVRWRRTLLREWSWCQSIWYKPAPCPHPPDKCWPCYSDHEPSLTAVNNTNTTTFHHIQHSSVKA